MKQFFDKKYHEKFKTYIWIKEEENELIKKFYTKIYKYINIIKYLPWLKMVWVWNSISMNSANNESDIDLYIVTSNNSMWFNRIIITLMFQLLWVRKNNKKHSFRFCLSFFSTIKWIDFSSFKIENDIYLYFWIVYFKPILNYDNTYENFININKKWANFDEYNNILENNKKYIKFRWKSFNENKITFFLDNLFKNIFIKKTNDKFEKIWKPYWVIINNNLLKFHNNDIRKIIKKELLD